MHITHCITHVIHRTMCIAQCITFPVYTRLTISHKLGYAGLPSGADLYILCLPGGNVFMYARRPAGRKNL